MKIILTFTLLMIPGVVSSMRVTGYSGGGVMITCGYDEGYRGNEKYFCEGQWSTCTDQIRTKEKNKWVQQDRFSLYDDTTSRVFTVTIRDLSEQDSGTYYCGTERVGSDPYTKVDLEVITNDCCVKSISLSAAAGGSVNISCKYPQSHRSDVKFLCWRSGDDLCAEESSVTKKSKWIRKGKIQLYDDGKEQLLTGSISHVTEQHSEYWCGVQSDRGDKSFITRVLIRVTGTSSTPQPSSSSAASFSSVQSSPFTGVSRTSTSLPSPNTSSGSSLIIVLVLVLLVLIIAGLSLLFLCKKHQSRGGDSPSQTGPREHEVVSYTGCDYEEIKDTHKQLPTNPSSNCVYATVQKATGDSQCCITSAEDLNYAVVNFHKESDCPDSVSIRNNQDYSEYAAVSHLTA